MAKKTPAPNLNESAPEALLADGMISDDKMESPDRPGFAAGIAIPPAEIISNTAAFLAAAGPLVTVPDAVAGLPPAEPSVNTAPDSTLVVTTTEVVPNPNATIGIDMGAPEGDQTVIAEIEGGIVGATHVLGDEAKAGLDDFLMKFERKVSERDGVRKILAAAEHKIQAVGQWPTRLEHALALPLADELDTLHEVEGLVIASFMDVGSVVRKVYLNVLGHFVKA